MSRPKVNRRQNARHPLAPCFLSAWGRCARGWYRGSDRGPSGFFAMRVPCLAKRAQDVCQRRRAMRGAPSPGFGTKRPVACNREDTAGVRTGTKSKAGTTVSLPVLKVGPSSSSAPSLKTPAPDMMTYATLCVSFVKTRHLCHVTARQPPPLAFVSCTSRRSEWRRRRSQFPTVC